MASFSVCLPGSVSFSTVAHDSRRDFSKLRAFFLRAMNYLAVIFRLEK